MTEREPQIAQIESEIQLLVEGKDQKNFFEAFLTHLSLANVQIQDFGGVNDLRGSLLALVSTRGFYETVRGVGIVRDAEESANAAFQSIQASLRNAGLSVPNRQGEPAHGNPSVTVLILPGDGCEGMLETLLCRSIADVPEETCIDDFFECVKALQGATIKRPDKARAHAYLTTKLEPHVSVGVAAKKGYWNLDHNVFDGVRQFLSGL